MLAAAGMVVTEISTPIRAPDFAVLISAAEELLARRHGGIREVREDPVDADLEEELVLLERDRRWSS